MNSNTTEKSRTYEIGKRIKKLRDRNLYNQKQFYDYLFESDSKESYSKCTAFISRIESGAQLPTAHMLIELNKKFGADIDYILTGEEKIKNIFDFFKSEQGQKEEFIKSCENISKSVFPLNPNFYNNPDEEGLYDEGEELGYEDAEDKPCMGSLRLKHIRKTNNLSTEQIAKKLSVNKSDISRWERSLKLPSTKTLLKYHDKMGVSINYILTGFIMPFVNIEIENIFACPYSEQKKLVDIFSEIIKFFQN